MTARFTLLAAACALLATLVVAEGVSAQPGASQATEPQSAQARVAPPATSEHERRADELLSH